jgi:O-methyltransferase involved in polyketide biosynthesis
MDITLPAFTPIEESLFLTLCGRALDYRSPHSILSDMMADEIVRKLDYDCERFRLSASPIINIALRAKKLDEVALRFVARHPDAVALDLGAGLDTRMLRIAPPPTVDWYDVDFPEVITARGQLIPDRANAHGVGADLTDPNWLDAIPTDRPAVIVADGLLGFLTQDEVISLLNRLVNHLPSGEIVFNSYTRFAIWAVHHSRAPSPSATSSSFPASTIPASPNAGTPN